MGWRGKDVGHWCRTVGRTRGPSSPDVRPPSLGVTSRCGCPPCSPICRLRCGHLLAWNAAPGPPPPPGAAGVAREKPVTTASGVGFLGIQAMLASRFPFLSSSGPPLLWSEERGGSCHSPVSGPLDEALGGLGRGGGGGEKTSPTSKNGDRDGT